MSYALHEEYTSEFQGPERTPVGWALHWWGDPAQNPKFWSIVNVLLQRAREQSASVNFVAEANLVACLIDPFHVAWAQGDGGYGWGNNNLVSVECNPRNTAADRETVAELMADQYIRNGIPIVVYPHHNFTATQCPGSWAQYIPSIVARAKQIVAEKTGKATTPIPAAPTPATPAPKPVPAAPAPAKGNGSGPGYCTVESGDTLYGIAKQFGKGVDQLKALNPTINPDKIYAGQRIYLLNHCIVESGDTLSGIASQFGFSLAAVKNANPGINYDRLTPGQVIYLE